MENFPGYAPEAPVEDDDDDVQETASAHEDRRDSRRTPEHESPKKDETVPDKRSEAKQNNDGEIPLEALADDELRLVAQQYIDARAEQLKQELQTVSAETPQEAEVIANAALLEAIDEKLAAEDGPTDEALDSAVTETVQELGIDLPEIPDEEPTEMDNEAEVIPSEVIAPPDEEPEDKPAAATSAAAATPSGSSAAASAAGSAGASAGAGPTGSPTVAPNNAGGSGGPPSAPTRGNYAGGGYPNIPYYAVAGNTATAPTPNPNRAPAPVIIERRSAALPYLIVGYLLGRRRGRIKTEKKLLPIQHKLEKEVGDLHKKIALREERIRALAREQTNYRPAKAEQLVRRLEQRRERKDRLTIDGNEHSPDALKQPATPHRQPEKLGKVLIKAETPDPAEETPAPQRATLDERLEALETSSKAHKRLINPERPKAVEALTLAELLVLAERIPVERSNVRKLFEANRLDDKGVRRIAEAFLRGERYEKILKDNLHSRETVSVGEGHERIRPGQMSEVADSQAGQAHPQSSEDYATAESRPSPAGTDMPKTKSSKAAKQRAVQAMPIAAVVIVALLLLLLWLRS